MTNTPLTIRVPIRGKLLIKLDGFDALHEVGEFTKELNVAFSTAGGTVDFQFDEKFWAATIKDRGVEPPTPRSTSGIVEDVMVENLKGWATRDTEPGKLAIDGLIDLQGLSMLIIEALDREGRLA